MQKWKKYILVTDVVSLYLSLVLALIVRGLIHTQAIQNESVWFAAHTIIFLPSVFFSILCLYIAGLYDVKTIYDKGKTVVLLLYAQFSTAIFLVIFFYIFKTDLTPKLTLFFYIIISILILFITRSIIFRSIQKLSKTKAFFIGEDVKLIDKITPDYGPFIFEVISDLTELKKNKVLIYDEKSLDLNLLMKIEELKNKNVLVYSYSQYYEFLYKKIDLENADLNKLIKILGERKESNAQFIFRRFIDIFCSLIILPFFILTLPFVYLGIYFQDNGKMMSLQNRISLLGRNVFIYKIRTMTNTDVGGVVKDDKNKNEISKFGNTVTPFGKFLRKTRIDELPQCINLLKGDISLIGPRADIIGVYEDMSVNISNYKIRLLVPQGLSGWAQVHMNFPPRTQAEYAERLAYDIYYVMNRSIFLDISVILKTIKTLLSREGA